MGNAFLLKRASLFLLLSAEKIGDYYMGVRRVLTNIFGQTILLKRRNGEITPFRNADFIPAFYFIPKSILDRCGSELNSIPRNPCKLLHDWDAIAIVESDLFLLAIIDTYAYMV